MTRRHFFSYWFFDRSSRQGEPRRKPLSEILREDLRDLDLDRVEKVFRTGYSDSMSIRQFLDYPGRVATLCLLLLAVVLVLNGNLWRLWGLHRDFDRLTQQIFDTQKTSQQLEAQLHQAKDPSFMERQARDRLDLAGENDLVFVFADE